MGHHQSSRGGHLFPANYSIDVVVARLDVEADAVHPSAALLSDAELQRSSRYPFKRDRNRFIFTAALLWAIACFLVACGGGGNGGGGNVGGGNVGVTKTALIFQTTFDIPEWTQIPGLAATDAQLAPGGDGIEGNGGWTTRTPFFSIDEITTDANNSAGGGGRGFRHWVGDGPNNAGGGIRIWFGPVSEMWLRYYIRFQPGFAWDGDTINMKTIYCNSLDSLEGTFYFGLHDGVIGGHVEFDPFGGNGNHHSTVTWEQWQGSSTGDGNFHVLEVHAKMNSTGASSDGVLEFWLDGTQIYFNPNVHFADTTGTQFTNCKVGENHHWPLNGADFYVDFDDIAISTAGYIGP